MKRNTIKCAILPIIPASLLTLQITGCNNSGSDGLQNTTKECDHYAYLDGELHGTLNTAMTDSICMMPNDDLSYDHMVIVSPEEGKVIDEETKAGLKNAYLNNQLVAIEHATENEVKDFLGALNLPYTVGLPDGDDYFEIYAVEKRNGDIHRFISTQHRSSEPESDDNRINNFIDWKSRGEERGNASREALKILASANNNNDLAELAQGESHEKDFSSGKVTKILNFDIHAAHSFKDKLDYYFITQQARINQGGEIGYYYRWDDLEGDRHHMSGLYKLPHTYKFSTYAVEDANNLPDSQLILPSVVQSSPQNKNNEKTVTSTTAWSEQREVAYSSNTDGQLTATSTYSTNTSYSDTITYSIMDLTLTNNSLAGGSQSLADWSYIFSEPNYKVYDPSVKSKRLVAQELAKGLFQPTHQWIWRAPPKKPQLQQLIRFKTSLSGDRRNWEYSHRAGKWLNHGGFADSFNHSITYDIVPPPQTAADKKDFLLENSESTEIMKVLSETSWKVGCVDATNPDQSATWCKIVNNNGDDSIIHSPTGSNPTVIYVEIESNNTNSMRFAHISVESDTDKFAIPIAQKK